MIEAWKQRAEPLGIIVADASDRPRFQKTGDKMHRFVTRNHNVPVVVSFNIHTCARPLVALLALGRRVGCCVNEQDDIEHVAKRLYMLSSGHLATIPVAVWSGSEWSSCRLSELV